MEKAITFICGVDQLIGICHIPNNTYSTGLLIISGGNQYRIGSHRQFVNLARYLEKNDIPVFRFDYRGIGDSEGDKVGFEGCSNDIKMAIDSFFQLVPDMKNVIVLGLCDGAAATSLYSESDCRVKGLVLLNPWVGKIDSGAQERALLKHYYLKRLFSKGVWNKIFKGDFLFTNAISGLLKTLLKSVKLSGNKNEAAITNLPDKLTVVERYFQTLNRLRNKVLVILSGEDLTANLFQDVVLKEKTLCFNTSENKFKVEYIQGADHTFSNKHWKREVEMLVTRWIKSNF